MDGVLRANEAHGCVGEEPACESADVGFALDDVGCESPAACSALAQHARSRDQHPNAIGPAGCESADVGIVLDDVGCSSAAAVSTALDPLDRCLTMTWSCRYGTPEEFARVARAMSHAAPRSLPGCRGAG